MKSIDKRKRLAIIVFSLIFILLSICMVMGWVDGIDRAVRLLVAAHRAPILNRLALLLNDAFLYPIKGLILLPLALFIGLVRHRWLAAVIVAVAPLVTSIVTWVFKYIFCRPRPLPDLPCDSFPSGHTTAGTVIFGLMAYAALRYIPVAWIRIVIVSVLAVLILATGWSRVYLSYHHPSDVLAGLVLGAIILTALMSALDIFNGDQEKEE